VHYDLEFVKKEIFEYCKDRWIAIKGDSFIRYNAKGEPLYLKSEDDIPKLINIYKARTIYSTAATYYDVRDLKIKKFTPFFDIDTTIEKWEKAIEAAKIIIEALNKEGIKQSIYLIWSGEGVHVRINENSLPNQVNHFIAAKSIVTYILKKTKQQLQKLVEKDKDLKIENLIDEKRLFTSPLSLHRELDLVAVCFLPEEIDDFKIEWANPKNFKHNPNWRMYIENEAESLVMKAIKETDITIRAIAKDLNEQKSKIGRFQVMGLLQASRYYVLYQNIEKAKSFGINRAIFYAWAKHYGRFYAPSKIQFSKNEQKSNKSLNEIAGEEVFVDEKTGYFIIGNKPNLPKDFDREIKEKIEQIAPFEEVWNATLEYLSSFPKEVLLDQRRFFQDVYLPVRDNFERILNKEKRESLMKFFRNEK